MNLRKLESEIQDRLDDSPYAYAARAIGFTFGPVTVSSEDGDIPFGNGASIRIKLPFTCSCGRTETFYYVLHGVEMEYLGARIDPAEELYRHGSFGAQHLLDDGYPPEWVDKKTKVLEKIVRSLTTTGEKHYEQIHRRYQDSIR